MCGIGCAETKFNVKIFNPHRPPRGGWSIASLPPDFGNEQLHWAWKNRPKRSSHQNPTSARKEVEEFLRRNGHTVNKRVIERIESHALKLWSDADPERFGVKKSSVSALISDKMLWPRHFWEVINVALSSDVPGTDYGEVLYQVAMLALHMLKTRLGCDKCVIHWTSVCQSHDPRGVVTTLDEARVWLWAAHNESRETHKPNPFNLIAETWGWETMTDEKLSEIAKRIGVEDIIEHAASR